MFLQNQDVVSANVIGILVWAKCINQPTNIDPYAPAIVGQIEHSASHVATLLDKFFPPSSTIDQAMAHIVMAGYQMQYKPDLVGEITRGDPFVHPQFVERITKQNKVSTLEESKQSKGSKKGKAAGALTQETPVQAE